MIRCRACKKFAKPHSILAFMTSGEVKEIYELKVICKNCGVVVGDYDYYEDLMPYFNIDKILFVVK